MINWSINAAVEGAGGAMPLRHSDNLKVPSRQRVHAARQVLESADANGVVLPAPTEDGS